MMKGIANNTGKKQNFTNARVCCQWRRKISLLASLDFKIKILSRKDNYDDARKPRGGM